MSRLVDWGGRLLPRALVEPPLDLPPGACTQCGGLGLVPEQIDEDRFDVMVKCWRCKGTGKRDELRKRQEDL